MYSTLSFSIGNDVLFNYWIARMYTSAKKTTETLPILRVAIAITLVFPADLTWRYNFPPLFGNLTINFIARYFKYSNARWTELLENSSSTTHQLADATKKKMSRVAYEKNNKTNYNLPPILSIKEISKPK